MNGGSYSLDLQHRCDPTACLVTSEQLYPNVQRNKIELALFCSDRGGGEGERATSERAACQRETRGLKMPFQGLNTPLVVMGKQTHFICYCD